MEISNKIDIERQRDWEEGNVFFTFNNYYKKKLQKYGSEEYIEIILLLIDKHENAIFDEIMIVCGNC